MKEKNQLTTFQAKCIECGNDFVVKEIKREKMKKDGVSMWIMHYDCPTCGKKHYCQIDNAETMRLFNSLLGTMKIIARARKTMSVPKELQSKYEKLSKKLSDSRDALMKACEGSLFLDESENFVKVNFVK